MVMTTSVLNGGEPIVARPAQQQNRMAEALHLAKPQLGIYKMHSNSPDVEFATTGSACFDVRAYIPQGAVVKAYNFYNQKFEILSFYDEYEKADGIFLNPGDRALIPTGLIIDIPEGYSVRFHPRSGTSWKLGLTLTNAEGVVDWDYVEESFISLTNISNVKVFVPNNERIAQAELIEQLTSDKFNVVKLDERPQTKTSRVGGFGHTGTK